MRDSNYGSYGGGSGGRPQGGQGQPPVAAGDEVDVRIDAVGEKGDGIARVKGFILFVPQTKAGDYVKIKITKVLPKVGFAQVVSKLEAPPAQAPSASAARPRKKDDFDESILDTSKDSDSFGEEESPAPSE